MVFPRELSARSKNDVSEAKFLEEEALKLVVAVYPTTVPPFLSVKLQIFTSKFDPVIHIKIRPGSFNISQNKRKYRAADKNMNIKQKIPSCRSRPCPYSSIA